MALKDFCNSRYKLPVQMLYLVLVIAAMGLSVPRLFMKNQPRTRANTIALGMGAKSLVLIGYELLSEHIQATTRESQEMHLPIHVHTSYKPTSEELDPSYSPPRRC